MASDAPAALPSPAAHLRAAAVAAAGAAMLILGFPGLDAVPDDWLADPDARAAAWRRWSGPPAIVAADLNRAVRLPLDRLLGPLQRPLRIAQSWALYSEGPNRIVRAELRVDGVLRYRSGDPDHAWLSGLLRYRKVRPVLQAACQAGSKNVGGLLAGVGRRAVRDFGRADVLELRCVRSDFPGGGAEDLGATWTVRAPDWRPE